MTVFDDHLRLKARQERRLLLIGGVFMLVNALSLFLLRDGRPEVWLHVIVWAMCAGGVHLVLQRWLPDHDTVFLPIVLFLSGWGILAIDRLLPAFADRQTIWLIIGMIVMTIVAILPQPLRWLRRYRYLWLVLGLALLLSTILFGQNPSGLGPQLWLNVGGFYFQPSELLKIIFVGFLASYLGTQYTNDDLLTQSRHRMGFSPRVFGPILLMWLLSVMILVWQRDLGSALLFFAIFLAMLYVASGRMFFIVSGGILILIAGLVAYELFAVVQLRVDIWINPWAEADGRAYQIVQSLMAFGTGGIIGEGIGQGIPNYIPVIHSDFILAAMAEEWGFIGVLAVIACFAILVMRGLRIGLMRYNMPFQSLLAVGLSLLLGIQALLIMGGVLKLVPLTGVTLPFVSYGGSSMLMSFITCGLLLRLSSDGLHNV